jgi:hypothetical protein
MHHLDAKHKYEYDDKRLPLSIEKKVVNQSVRQKALFVSMPLLGIIFIY